MQNSFETPSAALAERPPRLPLQASPARPPARTAPAGAEAVDSRLWQALLGAQVLSVDEQAALAAVAQTRIVAPGAIVFDRGDVARALVFAARGDVALGWRDAEGVFHIERPVHGPGWLDQSSAWVDDAHAMDARASTEAVIVELPRDAVQSLLERHPALAPRLIASLAREVNGLTTTTHELMHKDAPARFAAWLVQRLDAEAAAGRGTVRLGERKRDIASQLAITPETLSRLMRSLTRQGVISVAGYTVQVLDAAALRRLAASG